MDNTVKILSLLEGTKFSANNDIAILTVVVDLIYTSNKNFWIKGSAEREQLLALLAGKLSLGTNALQASTAIGNLVTFIQGITILSLSLVNGLGRSPISLQRKENDLYIRVNNKATTISLTIGKYDEGMGKLIREFKNTFYGKAIDDSFTKNELALIKETCKETNVRLKKEKKFMERVAKDPMLVFNKADEQTFSSGLFLVLSSLPIETLNAMIIDIGSYLPQELEETNEDMFKVNVRNYLTTSTQDLHELFKKIRLVLKLYFGKAKEIIAIIIKDKTKDYFKQILDNKEIKKQVQTHLLATADNQFELRIKILDGLVKLL